MTGPGINSDVDVFFLLFFCFCLFFVCYFFSMDEKEQNSTYPNFLRRTANDHHTTEDVSLPRHHEKQRRIATFGEHSAIQRAHNSLTSRG